MLPELRTLCRGRRWPRTEVRGRLKTSTSEFTVIFPQDIVTVRMQLLLCTLFTRHSLSPFAVTQVSFDWPVGPCLRMGLRTIRRFDDRPAKHSYRA